MPRINLLKRRLVKKTIKVTNDFVDIYSIAKEVNGDIYFLHDIDMEDDCLMWTPNRQDAIQFYNEQTLDTFIRVNLNNRRNIYVVVRKEQVDIITLIKTGRTK